MDVDVAVIGGGPAGAAAAIALKNLSIRRVLLIDREQTRRFPEVTGRFKIGESAAPGVGPLLDRLGLTSDLSTQGHLPYHGNCTLWGSDSPIFEDFVLRGQHQGWHLDRAAFDNWLLQQAAARGVSIRSGTQFESISMTSDGRWSIRTRDTSGLSGITASAVIDASGRRACVASRLGATRCKVDSLVAVATRLPPTSELLKNYSIVEAVPTGWWYASEIPSGEAVVMFLTDRDIVKAGNLRTPSHFGDLLRQTHYILNLLGSCVPIEKPEIHACFSQYCDRVAGPAWAAVGDAAIALDPLTSSGISSALSDGLSAAEAIARSLEGDQEGLRAFAKRCDAALVSYLTERKRIYGREDRWPDSKFWVRRRSGSPENIARAPGAPGVPV